MSDEIILRFLSRGLIDVGGDDTKLTKLAETASHLSKSLLEEPKKALPFSLIALDPDAPDDDPVIEEVVLALQKHWPSHVNTFAGKPIVVYRAIVLSALVSSAQEDDRIKIALVASCRNLLPFIPAGSERPIWVEILGELERQVDIRAEAEWSTPASMVIPDFELSVPSLALSSENYSVNEVELLQQIQAASGPYFGSPNQNPHHPHQNPQLWATEFSTRLSTAIAGVVNAAGKTLGSGTIDLSAPLGGLAASVSNYVDSAVASVSEATVGLQRRTNLLWWKEALFSPSARTSYRDLAADDASTLMAFDLHRQIPTYSPASVTAFLYETVMGLPGVNGLGERTVREHLESAQQSASLEQFRGACRVLVARPSGRGPLLGLIAHRDGKTKFDDSEFREFTGVDAATPLSLASWALWIFRELQAIRATAESSIEKPLADRSQKE